MSVTLRNRRLNCFEGRCTALFFMKEFKNRRATAGANFKAVDSNGFFVLCGEKNTGT